MFQKNALCKVLSLISIEVIFIVITGSLFFVSAQEPTKQTRMLEILDTGNTLVALNECTDTRIPVKFSQAIYDAEGDVSLSHVDIVKVNSYLYNNTLSIDFYLRDLPSRLTKNREGVSDFSLEYEWEVAIDTDNDPTTGSSEGTEYKLSATSWAFDPGNPISGSIPGITQQNTWVYSGSSWVYFESTGFNVDSVQNKMSFSGRIPNITTDSRLIFSTFDLNPGGEEVRDSLSCAYAPQSQVIGFTGGIFTSNETNTTVIFPENAVSSSTNITYSRVSPAITGDLVDVNRFFSLEAMDTNGLPITTFNEPITIVSHYTETASVNESSLNLYWLSGTTWLTSGITTVGRGNNVLTSTTTHFTTFAVLGEAQEQKNVYLPVVLR